MRWSAAASAWRTASARSVAARRSVDRIASTRAFWMRASASWRSSRLPLKEKKSPRAFCARTLTARSPLRLCLWSRAVNCFMQQRTGPAMITACAMYCDKTTDGYAATKWESDGVQVLVTVFGIAV